MLLSVSQRYDLPAFQRAADSPGAVGRRLKVGDQSSATEDREGEERADPASGGAKAPDAETRKAVADLETRDQAVRQHEASHLAAAGGLARGGAHFEYAKGPDGRVYAVGGEVQISLRGGDTPEETVSIAQQVRAAALAPADPSSQDLAVAGRAAALEAQARQELSARHRQLAAPITTAYRSAQGSARSPFLSAWA